MHAAEEMQLPPGAGRSHVQQTPVLKSLLLGMKACDPLIDRVTVLTSGIDRRQQQFSFTLCSRLLSPQEQFLFIVTRCTGKTRNNHDIEFQSFGLVDGHDLQAVIGFDVGQRIEIAKPFFKRGSIRQFTGLFVLIEITEKNLRIFQIGFIFNTGRSTQCEPRTCDLFAQRRAPSLRQGRCQRGTNACRTLAAIGRQQGDALIIMQRIPQRQPVLPPSQRMQVGQHQPAPRRAQHREPCQSVACMRQRAGQRQQILHNRALAQRLDVDGTKAQAGRFQRGNDFTQMTAGTGQYGHLDRRISGARSQNDAGNLLRFGQTIVIEKRMHVHGGAGQCSACRH